MAHIKRLLIVEDNVADQMAIRRYIGADEAPYDVTLVDSLSQAKKVLSDRSFDLIVTDYLLGDGSAFEILDLYKDIPVIVVTGAGNEEIAVKAMKAGAHDYLIKDLEYRYLKMLPLTVEKALRQQKTEEQYKVLLDKGSEEAVVISGDGLAGILHLLDIAARVDSPVLITGETGTGKNLAAKAIHYRSETNRGPFIGINCAALPENIIESELFGYEKGAFTGAAAARKGFFELAEGGTIFLDEIGEMPLHLQSKLLSAVEDKMIRRLGGETSRRVSVRIIAATGIDIEKALGKTFRQDLYYRLSVMNIHMPPLRDRRADIPALCAYFLGQLSNAELSIPVDEMERLVAYTWPGNVRELRNILERAVILQKGPELRPSELIALSVSDLRVVEPRKQSGSVLTLRELEVGHIKSALAALNGNITRTAAALGVPLSTFKKKLKEYGLK